MNRLTGHPRERDYHGEVLEECAKLGLNVVNVQKYDLGDGSWILKGKLPNGLKVADPESGLKHLLSLQPDYRNQVCIQGKMIPIPRFQQAYLRTYVFSGSQAKALDNMDPVLEELLDWCNNNMEEFTDDKNHKHYRFNGALVNWYPNGHSYIGPHSDDTRQLEPQSPIFSCSLGNTRTFVVKPKHSCKPVLKLDLKHLDFVIMGGNMQRDFTHEVPKVVGESGVNIGPRINITFRCFK